MILPSLFKVLRQVDATEALKPPYTTLSGVQPAPSVSLWAVGVGVVVFSAVKTEIGMVVFLVRISPCAVVDSNNAAGIDSTVARSSEVSWIRVPRLDEFFPEILRTVRDHGLGHSSGCSTCYRCSF